MLNEKSAKTSSNHDISKVSSDCLQICFMEQVYLRVSLSWINQKLINAKVFLCSMRVNDLSKMVTKTVSVSKIFTK